MYIDFSLDCQRSLATIKKKDVVLFARISKQLRCFEQAPNHHSLRLHKLKGKLRDTWSISINTSIRMVFYYKKEFGKQKAVFISIGTHKEVYG